MPTTIRGHRVGMALAVACLLGVALAAFGTQSALAQKEARTKKPADRVKALVLGEARSPVLTELKREEGWRLTRAANAKGRGNAPSKYDALVVDGDALSPEQLGEGTLVDEFADADQWVLALDTDPADYDQGLKDHTGFTVGQRSGESSMFLFSRQVLNSSPRVVMIETKSLEPFGSGNSSGNQEELRQATALQIQEVASSATEAVSADRSTLAEAYAPLGGDPPPEEAQQVGWTYTEKESSNPPQLGHWWGDGTKKECLQDYDPIHNYCPITAIIPRHGEQTANWTFNHYFDVYLDNANRPQGNFQFLTYQFKGQFSPKRGEEKFWHMFDPFRVFSGQAVLDYQMERAWWTQQLGVQVRPDAQTSDNLTHEENAPANLNEETHYSSEQEFVVGFEGSKEGAGFGGHYSVKTGIEHPPIPDWGVENKGSGNDLNWMFSARKPCDLRDEVNDTASCFNKELFGDGMPLQPTGLSLNQLQVAATGRWRTDGLLSGENGKATFQVKTPVAMADSVCTRVGLVGCATFSKEVRRGAVGPYPQNDFWHSYGIDIGAVNPIPMKSITFSPNPADGAKSDKVTGTVTLERPAPFDVKVVVFSNSDNATVGPPITDKVSRGIAEIPMGQTSGTFRVLTNDNNLKPGDHTTATITAFYTTPFQEQLRVESPPKGSLKP